MKIEKISINGTIKKPEEAFVSASIQGLMSGLGAFETFRVTDGNVFLMDKHFSRLQKSLKALGLNKIDETKAKENIFEIAKLAKHGHDAFVRFVVTANDGRLADFSHSLEPRTIIYMSSISKREISSVSARILEKIIRNKPEYFNQTGFRIKSIDYLHASLAQNELGESEAGIMLSAEGHVAEALTANIFWSKDGEIFTPPLKLGILPGITRQFLIENLEITEKEILVNEILDADEIFLSSSINFVTAVESINDIKKPGLNGPVFKFLSTKF